MSDAGEAEDRARRHRVYEGHRSAPAIGLVLLASALPLVLVALLPGDTDVFGLGRVALAATAGTFFVTTAATTIIGRVIGHADPRFRLIDLVETGVLHACLHLMVCLSSVDPTPIWFLPIAHAGFLSPRMDAKALKVSAGLMLGMTLVTLLVLALRWHPMSLALGVIVLLLMAGQLTSHRDIGRELDSYEQERKRRAVEAGQLALQRDRMRIARDLHDGIGAALATIAWRGHALRPELAESQRADLDVVTRRAEDAMGELRSLVWALHGPARRWSEVVDYLRDRVTELTRDTVDVVIDDLGTDGDALIDGDLSANLLHAVLEGVRNAVRHASASRIRVTLDARAGHTIVIGDDGRGLAKEPAAAPAGLGLSSLAERAAASGGTLDIASSAAGTEVRIHWPGNA